MDEQQRLRFLQDQIDEERVLLTRQVGVPGSEGRYELADTPARGYLREQFLRQRAAEGMYPEEADVPSDYPTEEAKRRKAARSREAVREWERRGGEVTRVPEGHHSKRWWQTAPKKVRDKAAATRSKKVAIRREKQIAALEKKLNRLKGLAKKAGRMAPVVGALATVPYAARAASRFVDNSEDRSMGERVYDVGADMGYLPEREAVESLRRGAPGYWGRR